MVDFLYIIYRGHKRFICLCPLGYHAARTQKIVKAGGAVHLDPWLFSVGWLYVVQNYQSLAILCRIAISAFKYEMIITFYCRSIDNYIVH